MTTPTPVRVLLAVRNRMIVDGLVSVLTGAGIDVVATATDGRDALNLALHATPDVAALDVSLSPICAVDIARELSAHTSVKSVLLSAGWGAYRELDAALPFARGFVPLTEPASRLVETIQGVALGELHLPAVRPKTAMVLSTSGKLVRLGAKQLQVLELVAHGYTNQEIGKQLAVSERTVGNHRTKIMQKLGVRNVVQLVRLAIRRGLANP